MKQVLRAALVAVLIAAQLPAFAADLQPPWRAQVQALLTRRAAAVVHGDFAAFASTMSAAPTGFKIRSTQSAQRLRSLGLRSLSLTLDPDGYRDLAAGLAPRPVADEVHVAQVEERIALTGQQDPASNAPAFLTVVRRGAAWSVVADDDLTSLGLLPTVDIWDFKGVRASRRSGVVVLTDSPAGTGGILDATIAARARVVASWPYPWARSIFVVVARTTSELTAILQSDFDLGPFVAFSVSGEDRSGGGFALTGSRVYVQPATFFSYPVAFRDDVLSHELTHVATRPHASMFTPSWLDEGVAQDYGERHVEAPSILAARVRAGRFAGRLPKDREFVLGGHDSIHLAYEEAASFIRYLMDRFGRSAGARLYVELGHETPDSFGTAGYHLDHAARRAFGVSFDGLQRGWAASVRREF